MGYLPFPVQRLTPHSVSRRARGLLAGDLGAHRDLPADTDDAPETPVPQAPAVPRAMYTLAESERAWARRRADLGDIGGIEGVLDEADARAKEFHERITAMLAAVTDG
jgi:hypothetical protein